MYLCKVVCNSFESELAGRREEIVFAQKLGENALGGRALRFREKVGIGHSQECAEEEKSQHQREKVQKGSWENVRKRQGPKYGGCESVDKGKKTGTFPKSLSEMKLCRKTVSSAALGPTLQISCHGPKYYVPLSAYSHFLQLFLQLNRCNRSNT